TELLARAGRFSGDPGPAQVRWLDTGGLQVRLVESPLDIAESMRSRVLSVATTAAREDDSGWPAPDEGPRRAWVFTSATLGDDDRLTWFTERAGLQDAKVLRVSSPFDYAGQAALYVPRQLPSTADPSHSQSLAQWLAPAVQRLGGRTLVLTTTLKALQAIGETLKACFAGSPALEILVQGEWPKRRLMERFREGSAHGQPGCVLVASATFWEGFDVPGDALQLVVIDKLPFPPPGDPLVQARSLQLEKAGKKPFTAYSLPEAAVALKQGAGRLIRRETDRGILVVGDTRLVSMGYGKRLLSTLPPMARLDSEAAFEQALLALTRTSTTDQSCP
ncbi:MAG: ATP-dependent DNA helicase, partial [Acidovorax sp.]